MTDNNESTLEPIFVRPRHDVHPYAYRVTAENMIEIAARLHLDVAEDPSVYGGSRLDIPLGRRYSMRGNVFPNDWIIVHPMTERNLEILNGDRFNAQYDRADRDLLDTAVAAEFPTATAWAIIADSPEGVVALPGNGIVSAAHLVGLASVVAGRIGAKR